MIGTLINGAAILLGSAIGLMFGAQLPDRIRHTVVSGIGLFTLVLGISLFLSTQNSLLVLGSLLIGALLGEWWRLEDRLENLGGWLESKLIKNNGGKQSQSKFVKGFVTASLVFCIGPMAILGSIQDGLTGDFSLLAIKSILDAFASLAFASTLGVGVVFSLIPTCVYQGSISLMANQLQVIVTDAMMNEMTAVGGAILVGLAISSLLEIRPIRIGSFLPSLVVAPILVAVLAHFGVSLP